MTSTEPGGGLEVRRAEPADADAIADLYGEARRAAVPAMPPAMHTGEEDRAWVAQRLRDRAEAWVAEEDSRLVGYALVTDSWLDHLFVAPDRTGAGIGTALLEVVKAVRPQGFSLWVFETNHGARRFYRRHGLVELEHTDGHDNEERAPDLRMAWPGTDPVAYLRGQVDEVDELLAVVLARRAALTAAIQGYKTVGGHAGRDEERERQIAERMAARAPGLPVEAWQRIMHAVITVTLDEAERRTPGGGGA